MDLNNVTVLITGANRGIGRALVARLAREPVRLVLAGVRSPERFQRPAAEKPDESTIRVVPMDLSSRTSIEACCDQLGEELGRVDLLVNNAGLMTGGLLEQQDVDDLYAMFQVNLVGVAHLTARVLPGMLARGSGMIVNNASISGYAYFPGASTYAASKAGVVAFTESLRRELRDTGVRAIHLVTPGVSTDMLRATEQVYGGHMDTSGWGRVSPEAWANRVVEAVKSDRRVLRPGGKAGLAAMAGRGPAWVLDRLSARAFSRAARR
jgi:short-subunit dehydrogenase